jgi:hypothetical protein
MIWRSDTLCDFGEKQPAAYESGKAVERVGEEFGANGFQPSTSWSRIAGSKITNALFGVA